MRLKRQQEYRILGFLCQLFAGKINKKKLTPVTH